MSQPVISLIAAIDEKRGLGKNNDLLFKIPEDQKRFREITRGHAIVMGRKTFNSIGRPLPERTNIVITRDESFTADGVIVVHSLKEALDKARETEEKEIFVIGGGEIYKQAIDQADKLYLTVIKGAYGADVFFPDYSAFTKILFTENKHSDGYSYTFTDLVR